MSLPWSGAQVEWLRAMGFEVLARPLDGGAQASTAGSADDVAAATPATRPARAPAAGTPGRADDRAIPNGLLRAARGIDLAPLLAAVGAPRDVASRRALWRALRPLRKAARAR